MEVLRNGGSFPKTLIDAIAMIEIIVYKFFRYLSSECWHLDYVKPLVFILAGLTMLYHSEREIIM